MSVCPILWYNILECEGVNQQQEQQLILVLNLTRFIEQNIAYLKDCPLVQRLKAESLLLQNTMT